MKPQGCDLQFHVLPGQPKPGYAFKSLYNASYAHYKAMWKRVLDRRAGPDVFDAGAFFRQSNVLVITRGADVAAQIFASYLHVDADVTLDLSYFENFKGRALEVLKEEGVTRLMTLEYSSVDPRFSPRKFDGICLGEIVTHLGHRWAKRTGAQVITGMPRRMTGTNDKVVRSGFRRVETAMNRCGLTVDIVLGFIDELVPHEDPETEALIERLWIERNDTTIIGSNTDVNRNIKETML